MTKLNSRELKAEAARRLRPIASQARKTALICVAATALVDLLGSGLDLILQYWISDTGGLSGMGTRSVLQTIQSLFPIISLIFTPLCSSCLTGAALKWADGRQVGTGELLSGFRRAPAILLFEFLWGALLFGLMIFASYVASILFMLMPGAEKALQIMYEFMESGATDLSALPVQEYLTASLPMMVIFLVLFAVMVVYMRYNLLLSRMSIMDDPGKGGFAAMKASLMATRGRKLELLKLDLRFWRYYLVVVVAYLIAGAGLLPLVLQGSMDPVAASFLVQILSKVLLCILLSWMLPYYRTTLALAYRKITTPEQPEENME